MLSHEEFIRLRWKKQGLSPAEIAKRLRWREQNRRNYQKHREKILARQRARYYADPKRRIEQCKAYRDRNRERFNELNAARQRKYRAKTWKAWYSIPENRAKVRAWRLRWYWERGGKEHLAESRSNSGWACFGKCGRDTRDPTGLCKPCRTTTCRTCSKPMIQRDLGQRVHRRCLPKGDDPWT